MDIKNNNVGMNVLTFASNLLVLIFLIPRYLLIGVIGGGSAPPAKES